MMPTTKVWVVFVSLCMAKLRRPKCYSIIKGMLYVTTEVNSNSFKIYSITLEVIDLLALLILNPRTVTLLRFVLNLETNKAPSTEK